MKLQDRDQDQNQLLRQCRQGNALAWEALVKQQHARLFGMAYYYLKNSDEAQDVTQEIFIRIYKGLGKFRGQDKEFEYWMLSVARNCCLDRIRKLNRRVSNESELGQSIIEHEQPYDEPESELLDQQSRNQIYQALDQFSDQNREIILLKEIQGMRLVDIANMLSLPLGTIKARASRARIALAKALCALDPDYSERSEGSR